MLRFALVATLLFGAVGCVRTENLATPPASSPEPTSASSPGDEKAIPVTTAKGCEQHCDLVAVIDMHTAAQSQDKGFDELRRRAASVGADAVINAEFEHGDGAEPSHLSGMAVRYDPGPPPYEEIGPVDVTTPENASDKGLDELRKRAAALGADGVVKVSFEHGDDGAPSRLSGTAVRYKR